jgi:hypothetical protein
VQPNDASVERSGGILLQGGWVVNYDTALVSSWVDLYIRKNKKKTCCTKKQNRAFKHISHIIHRITFRIKTSNSPSCISSMSICLQQYKFKKKNSLCWTFRRRVKRPRGVSDRNKPKSVRAAQPKIQWKCITYGSSYYSRAGPKLCVLEKNLALGR